MKNLANCKPSEFLKQTFRIKKVAEEWLTLTNVLEIRKNMPELIKVTKSMSDEEKIEAFEKNKAAMQEQSLKNLSVMLDKILGENPDKTLELLALCCFIEPEDADNHPIGEYLSCITELMSDQAVVGFFTSLVQLAQTNTPTVSGK